MGEKKEQRTYVGKSLPKNDALALATAQEYFTADYPLENPLHCALLHSPHAHAEIRSIDTEQARGVAGVTDILTFQNVPRILHTSAGQGYPEPSPYDAVLFDRRMRFVGDRVALVAAETLEAAREAVQKINVDYEVLEPLLDRRQAMSDKVPRLHGGEDHAKIPVAYEPERNLAAEVQIAFGDLKEGFAGAAFIEEQNYSLPAASHCAMEPHAALAYLDQRGRLVIVSTTQVPFHARRIVSKLIECPLHQIRVIKPRIGGGFGGKQEVILEPLVALVTWRNKRPARLVLSRREVFIATRTRHAADLHMKTAAAKDGRITALQMDCLLEAGAYGTHSLTVLSNVGAKVLPLFNKIENIRFHGRSVYTNLPVSGAYRGYGATQGYFAWNQQIDAVARWAGQDLVEFCKRWHIRTGETSAVFEALGEGKEGVSQVVQSCGLSECLDRGAREIEWAAKRDKKIKVGADKVKGVGLAIAMQGSGIPLIDMGAASMKMNEDGSLNLYVGATDIGTGSDTILAQIAAEVLDIPIEKILVLSSDTDLTPFDVGAYASSTTYVSGQAVKACAEKIAEQILRTAAALLERDRQYLILESESVRDPGSKQQLTFEEIATSATYNRDQYQIQAQASYTCQQSPPPFIAQFAEVDVDIRTGRVEVVRFVSAADCGLPINPCLAEGQIEGAVVNGLSYALWEEYRYDKNGRMTNPRFWDYKIFSARDIPDIRTILVETEEPTGPFGAKSIGEVAINGPAPAIANAVYDAVGVRIRSLPITPEKVWRGLHNTGSSDQARNP
ncbi:MAG: molybdopterin-dependent oxidoreductase [Spirochaetaceae bacterium]|nr:MAG: molybdopterin-dependent oxidoreductase [Spirochaetaceae bacterium]